MPAIVIGAIQILAALSAVCMYAHMKVKNKSVQEEVLPEYVVSLPETPSEEC